MQPSARRGDIVVACIGPWTDCGVASDGGSDYASGEDTTISPDPGDAVDLIDVTWAA